MKKYALFVGIDISKSWIDVSLTLDGQKASMPHRRFGNDLQGFTRMLNWIQSQKHLGFIARGEWVFCMEHTGVYGLPLMGYLQAEQLSYVVESAMQIKRSLGLSRGKDDQSDSKAIARYAYLHRNELKCSELPGKTLMRIKNLLSFRARLIRQYNALKVACQETADFQGQELVQDILLPTEDLVAQMRTQVRAVEKKIRQLLQEDPQLNQIYQLATSVKGIGLICAANMIVATNAFQAFATWRKFACYIGIAPFEKQSGSALKSPARVSHLGHKGLKALLTNATMSAIQSDKELKAYYRRKLEEGKSKYSIFNAIKNKLVSRVFATVKRGTPFVELHAYA